MSIPPRLVIAEGATEPLELDEFKEEIDMQGGYLQNLAKSVTCFSKEIEKARSQCIIEKDMLERYIQEEQDGTKKVAQYTKALLLPEDMGDMPEEYPEEHRSETGKRQDKNLPGITGWLKEPFIRPEGITDKDYKKLVRASGRFFVDEGCLYRRDKEGMHKLVISKDRCMFMMKASHDNLGHRGFYAMKELIGEQFWWPEMERDIS